LRRMGLTVFLLLGFNAFLSLGTAVYLTRLSGLLRDMTEDSYTAAWADRALATYAAALAISVLLMAATGPLFVAWLWRARRVADSRLRRPQRYRSGLIVGVWFIPLANLWLPPRIVRDVWLGTARTVDPVERQWSGAVVPAWWTALGCGLTLQALFALTDAATLEQARLLTSLQLAGTSILSLAAVLGMVIVSRIDRLQCAD
jgi:hypothetical protein